MNVRRHALGPPLRRTGPTRHRKTISRRRKLLISQHAPNRLTILHRRRGESSLRNNGLLELRGFGRGELDGQIQSAQLSGSISTDDRRWRRRGTACTQSGDVAAIGVRAADRIRGRRRRQRFRKHDPRQERSGELCDARRRSARPRGALRVRPARRSAGTPTDRSSRSPPDRRPRAGDRRAAAGPRR